MTAPAELKERQLIRIATKALKRAEAAERRVEELERVLEPFAKEAKRYPNTLRDDDYSPYDGEWGERVSYVVGDLRRARAALERK